MHAATRNLSSVGTETAPRAVHSAQCQHVPLAEHLKAEPVRGHWQLSSALHVIFCITRAEQSGLSSITYIICLVQVSVQCAYALKDRIPEAQLNVVENGGHFKYFVCDQHHQSQALEALLGTSEQS